ncbi:MAG: polyprenyl synthetase family protein [Gemmatimonadota bacterium]|nr:polyprenyl synthetase family protein [Gemmatimonadota bacterium]
MSEAVARARTPPTAALREIQDPVRERLDLVVEEMGRIVTSDLPFIEDVSRHLLRTRGKLFRPTLTLLSSAVEDRPQERAVAIAAAIELMHLATLVHDDSVDHSVLRRGLPTVNSLFGHQVSVIMGDFLYSRALTAVVEDADIDVLRVLTRVSNELTVGEMRQLAALDRLSFPEPEYYQLIRAKTATLLSAACEVGALCGAPTHRQTLALYGDRLGMAFQIADDILDYVEEAGVTGKPSGLDLREHKVTLPLIAALRTMPSAHRARVDALFAADEPTDDLVSDVVTIVVDAGGIDYARGAGERFAREAELALAGVPESSARAALVDAITYVMDRRS